MPRLWHCSRDPSAVWQGKQGTKGFVGKSVLFRGSERSRLGSAGSTALIPMQLEKGKQLQVPPDT